MIVTILVGIFFIFSHEQKIPSYRTACYQIFFKDSLNFDPGSFEIRFHRHEQSSEDITIFEQQHSVKVNAVGDTCEETLEVGRFTLDQKLTRYLNITLYFGKQEHVLDGYQFTLTEETLVGLYNIEGIYNRSLLQIRVVNSNDTFKEYYYDGPFYHQVTEFVEEDQYCLKLWHKFPGSLFLLKFSKKLEIKLPGLVTVNFHMQNVSSFNVNDLGFLYSCNDVNSCTTITIFIQPELAKNPLDIQLLDPQNKLVAQTVYALTFAQYLLPVMSQMDYHFYNLVGSYRDLQSCTRRILVVSTWDAEKGVMLYTSHFHTRRCNTSAQKCVVEEYLHDGTEIYAQCVCDSLLDSSSQIFIWKRFPKSEYKKCLSNSIAHQI